MNDLAIKVTNKVISNKSNQTIKQIAHDLKLIKNAIPELKTIVLRGGCAVDILYDDSPNDIDLFYTFIKDNIISQDCHCDYIQEKIKNLPFLFFNKYNIDLENSYEKEPRMDPIGRTIGLFSYHTDYISMFCIDENGEVWSSEQSLHDFVNRIYEMRYEGRLPWAYFHGEQKKDDFGYYEFLTYIIIRGVGYITKRGLKPGEKFQEILRSSDFIIQKAIESKGLEGFSNYAKKKILFPQEITKLNHTIQIGTTHERDYFNLGLNQLLRK